MGALMKNEHAWYGEWYVRPFDDHGSPRGSHFSAHEQIRVKGQARLVISGLSVLARAEAALDAAYRRLETCHGISEPCFSLYLSAEEAWAEKRDRRSGVVLPVSCWLSAFIAVKGAHLEVGVRRECDSWEKVPLLLVPSPLSSSSPSFSHVHTNSWRRAQW
jgi:hypothetical protein